MLNQQQIDIIKATAPVVGQHARDITETFYPLMFERYPSVKALFNQTHQQKGTQRQALANALVAYATHIDKLEALGDAVGLIAHKHCSLNILPEHYPIVGECLMEAIGIVLGDAVTEEIADAWGAAYQQLADLLIQVEEEIYQSNSERRGGWRGEREFRINRITPESEVISSFHLLPCEGEQIIDFTPGQYIGLIVEVDGQRMIRNYSLSDAPGKEGLRISVKHEQGGTVSGYLHTQAKEGDVVKLIPPAGDFTLAKSQHNAERPLVFVTGGVGITPAISMLNSCVGSGRPVVFVHAAINGRHHAFGEHVQNLAQQHSNLQPFFVYEKPLPEDAPHATGFVNEEMLRGLLPANGDVDLYFLGPKPFMSCVNGLADSLNIPASQRQYEFFGPAEDLQAAS
jgi:nitric oxide dioxygenase